VRIARPLIKFGRMRDRIRFLLVCGLIDATRSPRAISIALGGSLMGKAWQLDQHWLGINEPLRRKVSSVGLAAPNDVSSRTLEQTILTESGVKVLLIFLPLHCSLKDDSNSRPRSIRTKYCGRLNCLDYQLRAHTAGKLFATRGRRRQCLVWRF
jgi:hypothetical protein